MVRELQKLIDTFAGEASLTRCFLHIINLVAKTAIRIFDIPVPSVESNVDEAEKELRALAANIKVDELNTRISLPQLDRDFEDLTEEEKLAEIANSDEGWIDEMLELSDDERDEIDDSVLPVRLMLMKVSSFNLVINSCD